MRTRVVWWWLFLMGCSGATPPEPSPIGKADPPEQTSAVPEATATAKAASPPVVASAEPRPVPAFGMRRADAEKYVLGLINRDRAANGLPPVAWNETAAAAGRRQAADLAAHGVTAHFGTDGSVPEERYTEAGGGAMVMENAGCLADAVTREIDPDPIYRPERLEKIEQAFMGEVPPRDGHRQNILSRRHNAVGVGLAQPKGLDVPCLVEEFIDDYGEYASLPKKAKLGAKLRIEGKLRAPAQIAGVGFSRAEPRRPMSAAEIKKTHGYPIPSPYIMFFPAGFSTKIVLNADKANNTFWIEAPIGEGNRPGLYGVSVWGTFPGSKELVIVSLRTVEVQ